MAPMTSLLARPGEPMDWIVAASADERARGELSAETERTAHAAFRQHGCVLLRGVFAPSVVTAIDAMYRDYVARYGAMDARAMMEQAAKPPPNPIVARGEARFEITPAMTGAFAPPELYANPLLRRFLAPLLGNGMQLSSYSMVASHPGAPLQLVHRDYEHLFAEPGVGPNLPVYAVNVSVPLIDVDLEIGPTGVWPGSHHWPQGTLPPPDSVTACPIERGDCLMIDYRTLHTGLPNRSARVRPILYMVYARAWFFDDTLFFGTRTVDMSLDDYRKAPESARPLLARALSQAVRSQTPEPARNGRAGGPTRNPNDPSSWGKVGRNDPCPCGSGRKYKQCHGRAA
jgi:ectoine hydroxylase-related dioxygenase (phytanoyl-CoA dioxygenase family)